jgi:hypothetical protein
MTANRMADIASRQAAGRALKSPLTRTGPSALAVTQQDQNSYQRARRGQDFSSTCPKSLTWFRGP